MSLIKRILKWLAGKAVLYGLLVAALLAAAVVVPWLRSERAAFARHASVADQLEGARGRLERLRGEVEGQSLAQVDARLAAARARLQTLEADAARRGAGAKILSAASGDTDALLADGGRALQIEGVRREIALLTAARERLTHRQALLGLDARLKAATAETYAEWPLCAAAAENLRRFEARWDVQASLGVVDWRQHADLQGKRAYRCDRWRGFDQRRLALAGQQTRLAELEARADGAVRAASQGFDSLIARERAAAEGSLWGAARRFAERHRLGVVLWQAAGALALIIAMPFLIRLFCYFVLAPIAMRRPAIRLIEGAGGGAQIPLAERSAASVAVRLGPDEELLVRDGYLQTTSDRGAKDTQWLLDRRHPITSLITGLTFLTRVRGEGEVTTVSATRDPFAEVTVLQLPEGAACVLQPRVLAAVVQPMGRGLRVTSHWRLWSLNAWLTLQLRYLVFHGPVRLVLHGGRGVRAERAERGRVLGQRQVVGFSTDLSYSVTRNETFWPYFLGREPLLRDRVAAGDGVLIVEEAPMSRRGRAETPHGIEGLIDAGMKVFGL